MKRLIVMVVAGLIAAVGVLSQPQVTAASEGPEPGYLTVMWGRSNWEQASSPNCQGTPGTVTLQRSATELKKYGIWGVGGVVTGRTNEASHQCINNSVSQSSWQDIANLRTAYSWKFISQSKTYTDMSQPMTPAQLFAETGGTYTTLKAHGNSKAWGAFNYPNGKQSLEAQRMAMRYFAFGRKYDSIGTNTRSVSTVFPYPMKTLSVNGGLCNNNDLECYDSVGHDDDSEFVNQRTMSPFFLGKRMSPNPGEWNVVQFYRLVDGKTNELGDSVAWDCTSNDWRNRWTSMSEMYCLNSFREALEWKKSFAAYTQIVDPATIAIKWNRIPEYCKTSGNCNLN